MYDSEFNYYQPNEIETVLKKVINRGSDKINYRKKQYYNIPCAFDIETTSTYYNGEKVAFMYVWVLNINGTSIIGRTWDEFEYCINTIHAKLYTNNERIFVIYVHNLAFEFAFIARRFLWEKVFSIDTRKPIYARTVDGIEFRCSYLLSGYALAKVADNLQTFKIRKLVGDLDYYKVRHSKTRITEKELHYVINDGRIVVAYIQEEIERNGNIAKIPLTKTGYVRQACRRNCFSKSHRERHGTKYRARIRDLTLTLDEYDVLKQAFAGGFTHANPFYTNKILHDVKSYDFTSSYPSVMVAEKYPMSAGEKMDITSSSDPLFDDCINNYCCVFVARFVNVHSEIMFDNPISASKCYKGTLINSVLNNGRLVSADSFILALTNIDYQVYKQFYSWDEDKFEILTFYRYRAEYLPKEFVDSILTFYEGKTKLKNVIGSESEYLHAKENVNSCYGMAVTDILRSLITFEHDELWGETPPNRQEEIDKYNKNPQRFLFYPWGIFVTAYARRNLFSGILECGIDYVYADTDSIKVLNYEKHLEYFERYNKYISKRLEKACIYHGFSPERVRPKTIKGVEKPLGVWDDEGLYKVFKTLGAKRYMYLDDGKLHITVAGSNKKKTAEYLQNKYGKYYAFYKFDNNLCIPTDYSGRTTSCYIDYETSGKIKDYNGVIGEFHELTSVHVDQTEYNLSIASAYINYFLGIQEVD